MNRHPLPILPLLCLVVLSPCLRAENPAEEEQIFPRGSEVAGKTLFVEKGCYQCHVAGDVEFPLANLEQRLIIDLATRLHAGWTRDEFAKAIMHPDHTVSEEYRKVMIILGDKLKAENSPMPGLNEMLTVSDLIHLTTFLKGLSE